MLLRHEDKFDKNKDMQIKGEMKMLVVSNGALSIGQDMKV